MTAKGLFIGSPTSRSNERRTSPDREGKQIHRKTAPMRRRSDSKSARLFLFGPGTREGEHKIIRYRTWYAEMAEMKEINQEEAI
jgi:hypothetical protein